MLTYHVFEVGRGWMGALASERGLARLVLPLPTPQEVGNLLCKEGYPHPSKEPLQRHRQSSLGEGMGETFLARKVSPILVGLEGRLRRYFRGERVDFPEPLDLAGATPFQRAVWQEARDIPWGQVRSYGQLAAALGVPGASRAVGRALGGNPLPIIVPCHRVLRSDGGLGGYSGPGGVAFKAYLLRLEGVLSG